MGFFFLKYLFLSVALSMQSSSRNILLKLNFAHCSSTRSLGVYNVWDSASLKRRVETDGPVVVEMAGDA